MSDDTHALPHAPAHRRARLRLSSLVVGILLGTFVALAVWLVILGVFFRDVLPEVTRSELDAAADRWQQNGPHSYNMDLVLSGRRAGTVHVEVRDGVVTAMTRDGKTPRQRRTWDYWSVPSQLDTIEQDLQSAANAEGGFGAPAGSKVVLRARFDHELGYPQRYQRFILDTPLDVEWRVTRFEVVGSGT